MNANLKPLIIAAALAVLSIAASAQPADSATPRFDQRQAKQEQRIDQGVAKGTLTARETRRLEGQQRAINPAENQAKADGTVTGKERHRLHHMQNHASRDIRRQKHDAQAQPKTGGN